MAPSLIAKRFMIPVRAFIDETEKDGVFVLGGYLAGVDAWARFSAEWEPMVERYGVLTDDGGKHFKMQEMAKSEERMERVPWFYRIIERHALAALHVRFNLSALEGARRRISVPNVTVDYGFALNPWLVAYRALMETLNDSAPRAEMASFLPEDAVVEFFFDERLEKKQLRRFWDEYLAERSPETRRWYGPEPRFENDRVFLPLQAADLWVWWVREWHKSGTVKAMLDRPEFGSWTAKRLEMPCFDIWFEEDDVTAVLIRLIQSQLGPEYMVIDTKYSAPARPLRLKRATD
jgi:hypothetical protein